MAGSGRRRSRATGYVEDDARAASRAAGALRRRANRPSHLARPRRTLIRSSSSPFSALTRRRALLAGTETLGGTRPDSLVKTRHRSRPWRRRGRSPTATLCLAGGEARRRKKRLPLPTNTLADAPRRLDGFVGHQGRPVRPLAHLGGAPGRRDGRRRLSHQCGRRERNASRDSGGRSGGRPAAGAVSRDAWGL